MKRRQIVSILAALALAVGSSALLTGCAGKSYYYKAVEMPDGTVSYELVGEIVSNTEGATTTSTADTTTSTPSETTTDESSEAPAEESTETPADEPSEEPADESSAEGDTEQDENTLAVIKFEKPEDWDGSSLYLRVYDSNSNNNGTDGQKMTEDSDGLYTATVSKTAENGIAFESPRFMFLSVTDSGKVVQSEEGTVDGDKTYGVEKDGRKYVLVEK